MYQNYAPSICTSLPYLKLVVGHFTYITITQDVSGESVGVITMETDSVDKVFFPLVTISVLGRVYDITTCTPASFFILANRYSMGAYK